MRLKTFLRFALVLSMFSLWACNGAIRDAQNTGKQFYGYLQSQNYQALHKLIDTAALHKVPFDKWLALFRHLEQQRGKITDIRQTAIEFFYDKNQNLIVKIHYKVFHNFNTYNETLILIRRHNSRQFKVLGYDY